MKRPFRRTATVVLGVCLIPALLSTTQAGVIPWLYDAVFGPVRRPWGAGRHVSYAQPFAAPPVMSSYGPAMSPCGPGGCPTSTWTTGRAVTSSSVCGPGGCTPAVSYYGFLGTSACDPCAVGGATVSSYTPGSQDDCPATTEWKSKKASGSGGSDKSGQPGGRGKDRKAPEPAEDDAPSQRTFVEPAEPAEPAEPENQARREEQGGQGDPFADQETTVERAAPDSGAKRSNASGAADDGNSAGQPSSSSGTESDPGSVGNPPVPSGTAGSSDASSSAGGNQGSGGSAGSGSAGSGSAGFGETRRNSGSSGNDAGFAPPRRGSEPAKESSTEAPLLNENDLSPADDDGKSSGSSGSDEGSPLDLENLENRASWEFQPEIERIAFRPGFRSATIARRRVRVDVDYVIPQAARTRLVSR